MDAMIIGKTENRPYRFAVCISESTWTYTVRCPFIFRQGPRIAQKPGVGDFRRHIWEKGRNGFHVTVAPNDTQKGTAFRNAGLPRILHVSRALKEVQKV